MTDDRRMLARIADRVNEPPDGGENMACGNCIPTGAHVLEEHEDRVVPDPKDPEGEGVWATVCRHCDCTHFRPAVKEDYVCY